jgi:hypothetical protein
MPHPPHDDPDGLSARNGDFPKEAGWAAMTVNAW